MEKYQTFIPRFWALILDSILLLPLIIVDQTVTDYAISGYVQTAMNAATGLFGVFYVILMHYFFGQTVGKMLMKVEVLDISEKPLSFFQAVLRDSPQLLGIFMFLIFGDPSYFLNGELKAAEFANNIVSNSFYILLMIWGLADIIVFFRNDKRRALHDYLAGSVVIKIEPENQANL